MPDPFSGVVTNVPRVESRAAQRYRILQRCIVRPPGAKAADGWQSVVYSLSMTGIGVTLPMPMERDTELDLQAWNVPDAPPLKARVVQSIRLEGVWLTGCELSRRLTKDELAAWLVTATAGP
jgi:hypothetical protein